MTFLQFCSTQFLYERDREQFKQFLGSKANTPKSQDEWWKLFQEWQIELLSKRRSKNGANISTEY